MSEATEDPRADELESLLTGQNVIGGGTDADLCTSMRPGENPEAIAREIEGIEYVKTEPLSIGRLAFFDLVEEDDD